jgi:hypothetical protein
MQTLIKVWLEWDLGQDNLAFTDTEKAKAFINRAILADETLAEQFPLGFVDVYGEGLCGFETINVI